ncbi:hypothetical protein HYPSUDRAFT_1064890 [Hypholoma sublateritium FD-334 SS-4]|uniref:Uncharacterized protein n=1 Tax=Hypholoma sublateritium (strain FD-334 SS-4) TaxID=945553 RepID=A0A0D2LZD0_HYPSF|nr:hypothetical protein HYPSUDRAFT_1064890 [Hypholoma sublateritium FD-334 SS-4]
MANVSVDIAIKYLLTFATCVLGLLRARMDDRYLSVHDNDAHAGHPIISVVLEVYGQFLTAIIYTFVEIVACIRFALIYKLQGSRKHILPVVKRRSQAILYAWCERVIHWVASRTEKFSRTAAGAVVSRLVAPCTAVVRGCHEDLCALFGNDCFEVAGEYLLCLLGRGFSCITSRIGTFLDSVALKAHRSTLLWLVYMPIATWFSLSLCALSVSLAVVAPYTFYASPASPTKPEVSVHPGQPLRSQNVAVEIEEEAMSATYHNEYSTDFGSNAFISTSTSTSIHVSAVQESPSLNLSVLLADMDPHADMSTLLTLEMNFVPEIYVTPADESGQISRLSERHFEISRSYDELKDISNFNNDAASQEDIFPPNEALPIASVTASTETVSDLSVVEEVADSDSQAGNAEVAFTSSEAEILATLLLQLDARDASGTFRPYLDSSALIPRRSAHRSPAPISPPAVRAHEAVEIFDRFTDYQAPPVAPTDSKLYAMYSHGAAEVVISADDALWRASARAGVAAAMPHIKPATPPRFAPAHMHTEGVENRPQPLHWSPGRSGAIPIVAPPPSRRRRSAPVIGGALATGDKRRDYLTRRALS